MQAIRLGTRGITPKRINDNIIPHAPVRATGVRHMRACCGETTEEQSEMHPHQPRDHERCHPERTALWRSQGDEPIGAAIP